VGIEIERKFLVSNDEWRESSHPDPYSQGYLISDQTRTVRVRRAGDKAYLTIKGKSEGMSRVEFEYEIPLEDAFDLFKLCQNDLVEKKRSKILWAGKEWEVDEFEGKNKGLILAELELESEDESFDLPPWIGKEVTGDPRYYNSYLSAHPFSEWR
jgi:CYTH domain-containing protein